MEWFLGCVKYASTENLGQGAGFTQSKNHNLAHPCRFGRKRIQNAKLQFCNTIQPKKGPNVTHPIIHVHHEGDGGGERGGPNAMILMNGAVVFLSRVLMSLLALTH